MEEQNNVDDNQHSVPQSVGEEIKPTTQKFSEKHKKILGIASVIFAVFYLIFRLQYNSVTGRPNKFYKNIPGFAGVPLLNGFIPNGYQLYILGFLETVLIYAGWYLIMGIKHRKIGYLLLALGVLLLIYLIYLIMTFFSTMGLFKY